MTVKVSKVLSNQWLYNKGLIIESNLCEVTGEWSYATSRSAWHSSVDLIRIRKVKPSDYSDYLKELRQEREIDED